SCFSSSGRPARLVPRDAMPASSAALPTDTQSTVPPGIWVTRSAAPVWNMVLTARIPAACHHCALMRYFIVFILLVEIKKQIGRGRDHRRCCPAVPDFGYSGQGP